MFRNYFKIAFRTLQENLIFSCINVIGLSLGMAAFILIIQYISYERSINAFHTHLNEIQRALFESKDGRVYDYSPPVLAPAVKQAIGEVQDYCRIADGIANGIVTNKAGDQSSFKETRVAYVDGSFFQLFSFPIHQGSDIGLKEPNTTAISLSTAKKYFGDEVAIGKLLTINNEFGENNYNVVAVFEDFPETSDLKYDILLSLQTLANPANLHGSDWANIEGTSSYLTTYFQLLPSADKSLLERKINEQRNKMQPEEESLLVLQPLRDVHLAPALDDRLLHTGNLGFIYLLSGVAALILIIAWLNFINLSTAGALKRAKEVGLRKMAGARRSQLIIQFLGESFLLNIIGVFLAMMMINLFQPVFNEIIGKNLNLSILRHSTTWAWGLLLLVVGTILSGAYTAFALSSFNPAHTLKGAYSKSTSGLLLRKVLVVFQFSISIILIAATLVLYRQLTFMQNQNLGMNINQLLVINGSKVGLDSTYKYRKESFKNKLSQASFVEGYCGSASVPTDGYNYSTSGITQINPQPGDEKSSYSIAYVDNRFFSTYEITFAAGNDFTENDCSRSGQQIDKVIINERASAQLGFTTPQEAVGKKMKWNEQLMEIQGVVNDYHHLSLKQTIDPIVFVPQLSSNYFTLKVRTENMQENIAYLKNVYQQFFPGNPFEYFFVDENYKKQYSAEEQYGQFFTLASTLAIFIACLGLFGLATFTVEQRTKEIGIRKVLGANTAQVVLLISRDFLLLVAIAAALAIPVAWISMDSWIQQFPYRTEISVFTFTFAGGLALFIAFFTISAKSIQAASSNPVNSLRNE